MSFYNLICMMIHLISNQRRQFVSFLDAYDFLFTQKNLSHIGIIGILVQICLFEIIVVGVYSLNILPRKFFNEDHKYGSGRIQQTEYTIIIMFY